MILYSPRVSVSVFSHRILLNSRRYAFCIQYVGNVGRGGGVNPASDRRADQDFLGDRFRLLSQRKRRMPAQDRITLSGWTYET
jgi:hypothetical protein